MVFTYAKEYRFPEQPLLNLRFMPTILGRRNAKRKSAHLRHDNPREDLDQRTEKEESIETGEMERTDLSRALARLVVAS